MSSEEYPDGLLYHSEHDWAKVEGDTATLGITWFAQDQLGELVFFDPPAHPLVKRHFGSKPHMFGKIVYGVPGDVVSHRGAYVLINNQTVAHMKPLTRFGEPLTPAVAEAAGLGEISTVVGAAAA